MHIIPILGLSLFVLGGVGMPAELAIDLPGGLDLFETGAAIGAGEGDDYGIDIGDIRENVGYFRLMILVQHLISSIILDRDYAEL